MKQIPSSPNASREAIKIYVESDTYSPEGREEATGQCKESDTHNSPRNHALKASSKSVRAKLEANLVVSLASRAVCNILASLLESDGNLGPCNAGAGEGGAEH